MFIVVSELPNHPEIHLKISRISSATKVSFLLCDYGSSETELCCRCCKMRFMMLFLHRYQLSPSDFESVDEWRMLGMNSIRVLFTGRVMQHTGGRQSV